MEEKGFSEILKEAQALHSRKNNDYGGSQGLYKMIGVKGRYADCWRKIIRMHSLVWEGNKQLVPDEPIRDTAIDLIVYTVLLVLVLDEQARQKKLTDVPSEVPAPKEAPNYENN